MSTRLQNNSRPIKRGSSKLVISTGSGEATSYTGRIQRRDVRGYPLNATVNSSTGIPAPVDVYVEFVA